MTKSPILFNADCIGKEAITKLNMRIYRPKLRKKLDGVFYWICPGQIFVTDSLNIRWESEGLTSRFVPWPIFEDPFDDFEFNEALNDRLEYLDAGVCIGCNRIRKRVAKVEFSLRNDTCQPLVHGVGTAYAHSSVKEFFESSSFKGFRFVQNSKKQDSLIESSLQSAYWFLDTFSDVCKVPGIIKDGDGYCSNCKRPIVACVECGEVRSRCQACKAVTPQEDVNTEDIFGNPTNGSGWPVKLSTWNLDDAVSGQNWVAVTGELLEWMIGNYITPFAFGPIDTECDGATDEQYQKALEVRREIDVDIP